MQDGNDRKKKSTVRDVAAHAKVSLGTVSRVIAGSTNVSQDLRRRVLSAMNTLGYVSRPRKRPSAPRRGKKLIACFVSDMANLLYGQVVSAAEERLAQLDYTLLIADTYNESHRESDLLEILQEGFFEGAIVSFGEETHPGLSAALARAGVPAIILDRQAPAGIDSILVDHRGAAASACSYLIGLGHQRIAIILASDTLQPGRERIAGYRSSHAEAGLPVDRYLVRTECTTADAAFSECLALLTGPDRPTALLTLGSQALGGTLRAIRAAGMSYPGDVSLICFGDTEMARIADPAITCMHWDRWQLGRQAADMLLRRMENPQAEVRSITLPTEVILRGSCQAR